MTNDDNCNWFELLTNKEVRRWKNCKEKRIWRSMNRVDAKPSYESRFLVQLGVEKKKKKNRLLETVQ